MLLPSSTRANPFFFSTGLVVVFCTVVFFTEEEPAALFFVAFTGVFVVSFAGAFAAGFALDFAAVFAAGLVAVAFFAAVFAAVAFSTGATSFSTTCLSGAAITWLFSISGAEVFTFEYPLFSTLLIAFFPIGIFHNLLCEFCIFHRAAAGFLVNDDRLTVVLCPFHRAVHADIIFKQGRRF